MATEYARLRAELETERVRAEVPPWAPWLSSIPRGCLAGELYGESMDTCCSNSQGRFCIGVRICTNSVALFALFLVTWALAVEFVHGPHGRLFALFRGPPRGGGGAPPAGETTRGGPRSVRGIVAQNGMESTVTPFETLSDRYLQFHGLERR